MTPAEIWPMIAGAGAVVYGAGHIVGALIERTRNGKYQHLDLCDEKHNHIDGRLQRIESTVDAIWKHVSQNGNGKKL